MSACSDSGSERSQASQDSQENSDLTIIRNGIREIHRATSKTRDHVDSHLKEYEARFKGFEAGLRNFKQRFDRIDKFVDSLDQRFGRVDQRFDGLEQFLRGALAGPGDVEDHQDRNGEATRVMDEDVRAQSNDVTADDEEVDDGAVEGRKAEKKEAEQEAEEAEAEAEVEQAEAEGAGVGETNGESENDQKDVKKPQRDTKAPTKPKKDRKPAKTPSNEVKKGKGIYGKGYTEELVTPETERGNMPNPEDYIRKARRVSRLPSTASAANTTTDDRDLNDDEDDGGATKKRKRSTDALDGGKLQTKSKKPKKAPTLSSVKEDVEGTDEHGHGATAIEDNPIEPPPAPGAEVPQPSNDRKRKIERVNAAEVTDGKLKLMKSLLNGQTDSDPGKDDETPVPEPKRAKKESKKESKKETGQAVKQERGAKVKQDTKNKAQSSNSNNSQRKQ